MLVGAYLTYPPSLKGSPFALCNQMISKDVTPRGVPEKVVFI